MGGPCGGGAAGPGALDGGLQQRSGPRGGGSLTQRAGATRASVLCCAVMQPDLPADVIAADRVHHAILERVAFSRHLNPSNIAEARQRFLRGERTPPFVYQPLDDADAILRALDAVEPRRDHPAGALVGACMDGTRLLVRALRDRTAAAFDAMNLDGGWYPSAAALAMRFPEGHDRESPPIDADSLTQGLRGALDARGLWAWRVEPDAIMSARVLVDSAKRMIRVNPRAAFRAHDLVRLVAHEIDVHVMRAHHGADQALLCFQTGLPRSLGTEEGLAMLAEHHADPASSAALARQVDVLWAIDLARGLGFRELFEQLVGALGVPLSWSICVRVKRGLARPAEPGVYAKDSVYLLGTLQVRAWLDAGGALADLYVGKVGVEHPVAEWVAQGWVRRKPLPALWGAHAAHSAEVSRAT